MQKQQYTLFLTRDDGATRSTRFCGATLRLLIGLCVAVPVIAVMALYGALQSWQDAAVLSHKNELLSQELQVCQQELQKYATIQQLVTRYEHEASPILMATKAVPAPVPYPIKNVEEENSAQNTSNGTETNEAQENDANQSHETSAPVSPEHDDAYQKNTDDAGDSAQTKLETPTALLTPQPASKPSAESILEQQNKTQCANQDSFTTVTDDKAKLTDITIHEDNGAVHTTFTLSNTTDTSIAGHLYVTIQGHDKKLYPIWISEKHTAFRILRFREYTLNFALPNGFTAADVDKIIITAKTRDGEVFYCNGFTLD